MKHLPLEGLVVLEFSQYLSGPSAGLRLADLGARVIKIERPNVGDACRQLAIKNLWQDESSLLFHTINRNKESFAADLKNAEDLEIVKKLIKKADVMTHNFRPGVMEKIGLDYPSVQELNPKIIYAEISGYGKKGPWMKKPGQDLLLQSTSGLTFTSGNQSDNPVPFGIAIADIICGSHLVQGILGALIRRNKKNIGAHIEVSLLESLLDFQFELLTTYFSSKQMPLRSRVSNGNPLLSAPYGIYAASEGYIAIAMVPLGKLAEALNLPQLLEYKQQESFCKRDEIKEIIAEHISTKASEFWINQLQGNGIWSMEVLNWKQMREESAYRSLDIEQTVGIMGHEFITTRCPIRINGEKLTSRKAAPVIGQHNKQIIEEFISC